MLQLVNYWEKTEKILKLLTKSYCTKDFMKKYKKLLGCSQRPPKLQILFTSYQEEVAWQLARPLRPIEIVLKII